ncbi:type VII secretion target [Mycobacterium sp. NPDC006124]|uniref:type VII secretion target n=1 Tax=Mycobacterium sp. NPDC006124 TaxID=3156729 RepID=UPI0033B81C5A
MIADISDIHGLSTAHRARADELTAVAADLHATRVASDAFGTVGADFLDALNDALLREARLASQLAERLTAATHVAGAAADAYLATDHHAGQSISRLGA